MRNTGIEIEININQIPPEIISSGIFDVEYSSKNGYNVLWIHDDGYKPFLSGYFQYLGAALSAYNRKTGTDHLDLFIETSEDIDEHGIEVDGVNNKNIRFSELGGINLQEVKFKRDVKSK
jgi:hypothetical protein